MSFPRMSRFDGSRNMGLTRFSLMSDAEQRKASGKIVLTKEVQEKTESFACSIYLARSRSRESR